MKSVAEESTRNHRRGEGKGGKDITRPRLNLILPQIVKWNQKGKGRKDITRPRLNLILRQIARWNRNQIPILIQIHHRRLT